MQLTVVNSYWLGGVVENTEPRMDDVMLDLYSIELRRWWDPLEILGAVAVKRFPGCQKACRRSAAGASWCADDTAITSTPTANRRRKLRRSSRWSRARFRFSYSTRDSTSLVVADALRSETGRDRHRVADPQRFHGRHVDLDNTLVAYRNLTLGERDAR
jgi:hypothetical protein